MSKVLSQQLMSVAKEITVGQPPCVTTVIVKLHYGVNDDIHQTDVVTATLEPDKNFKYEASFMRVERFLDIDTYAGPKTIKIDDHEYGPEELEEFNLR